MTDRLVGPLALADQIQGPGARKNRKSKLRRKNGRRASDVKKGLRSLVGSVFLGVREDDKEDSKLVEVPEVVVNGKKPAAGTLFLRLSNDIETTLHSIVNGVPENRHVSQSLPETPQIPECSSEVVSSLAAKHTIEPDSPTEGMEQLDTIDLEKLRDLASELNNGAKCRILPSLTRIGSKNIIIFLAFKDSASTRWIARFPLIKDHLTDNTHLAELIESMVVTMGFISERTSIPVPKVHHWNATSTNVFGRPYVIMDAVKGNTLLELERSGLDLDVSKHELAFFVSQWAFHCGELAALVFPGIGSLRFGKDDPREIILGGLSSRGNVSVDSARPFQSAMEYFFATAEHNAARNKPSSRREFLRSKLLESLLAYYVDPTLSSGPFVLTHANLDLQHILVDRGFKITGIIDWDFAAILPLQSHLRIPDSLTCDIWPVSRKFEHRIMPWQIEFAETYRPWYTSCLLKHVRKLDVDYAVGHLLDHSYLFSLLERSLRGVPTDDDLDLLWTNIYGPHPPWRDTINAMSSAHWGVTMSERLALTDAESLAADEQSEPPVSRAGTEKPASMVRRPPSWSMRIQNKVKWGWWYIEQLLLCQLWSKPNLLGATTTSEKRYSGN
jgi:aminoglycoside phosphotransferase (APT) family kinase protein